MFGTAWRLGLACIAVFAAVFIWMVPQQILSRMTGPDAWFNQPPVSELIMMMMYIGAALLFVYLLQTVLDHRPFRELGLAGRPGRALGQAGLGALAGGLGIAAVILAMWGLGAIQISGYLWADQRAFVVPLWAFPLGGIFKFLAVGLAEELFFRGYVLQMVWRRHRLMTGAAVSAVAFAALHFANPGYSIWAFLNVILVALLLTAMVLHHGNLWGAIGFHFAWDWVQTSLLNVPAGPTNAFHSLVWFHLAPGRSIALTGGTYWPEGSALVTAVLLLLTGYYGWRVRSGYTPRPTEGAGGVVTGG